MRSFRQRKNAIEKLEKTLQEFHKYIDVIVVEGLRDVSSLRSFGCITNMEVLNQIGVNNFDLTDKISKTNNRILILTDFDDEGNKLNKQLSYLFERMGVKIEVGFRRKVGHLMSKIGVYTIEALDNIKNEVSEHTS